MIRKTNSSEVFDIFAKTMISRMAARSPGNLNKVAGQFSIYDDVFEGIMKLFKGDVPLLTSEKKALLNDALIIPNHRELKDVFNPSINLHKDISSGIKVFTEASPKVRDHSLPELNEIAKKYGFNNAAEAYNTARDFPAELSALTRVEDLDSFRSERIAKAYKFFADPDIQKVLRESEESLSAPVRSTEPTPSDAATPRVEPEEVPTSAPKSTDDEIESLEKKLEQAETKSKEVDSAGRPTPAARAASKEAETLTKQLKDRQNQTWSQWLWRDWTAAATAKGAVSLFAGLIKLSIFGIPLYGIYYFFSSATSSTRDKASTNITTSKNCLDEINTVSGTKAESMKISLSQDLDRLNQMTSLTSGSVTEEFVQAYANLIDKVGGTGAGSIFAFANHLQQNPGELVGGLSAQVSESMSCVVTNFNEAKKIIMSLAAKIVETGRESPSGGRTDAEIPSISGNKNSISGDVTLANGSTYTVVITTRRPSIPPRFILFFQDGRNPFFSSPTFTAFVDPSPDGKGLVPNAVGKPLAGDGRIAAAIKYCYNNRIKTESDLRKNVIKSINSGLSPLRKLIKNEPEQKAFEKMIDDYKKGGGSSSESFSDDHMDINKSSEYQNNLFESINKTSSTMNKLALSNDKITYHEDAVKGLKDKLTKSYYAGLDSMYNEKPKAQKTDLKDLYGFQEETGYDLLMEAHPKSTYLAEAMGDGGLVENGLEQKVKSEAVALSVPSGNFRSKYAETHAYLNKLLKVAEAENKTEVSNLIKQTINQFFN